MKNLNVRTKVMAGLLAGGLALSLTACGDTTSRKVIERNNIDTSISGISFGYDNCNEENPNVDYSNTNTKIFGVGEHNLMLKVAGTLDYDEFMQVEVKDGYEITDFIYCENATSEHGFSYGYFAFLLKNTEPVEVVGHYDTEKKEYVYTNFGTVVEKEKQLSK